MSALDALKVPGDIIRNPIPLEPQSPPIARPFVKMAGGKTKLIPELLKYVPKSFRNYHEPFVGGGALFFYLRATEQSERHYTIGDTNEQLITSYRVVRNECSDLVRRLRGMKNNERFFYKVREIDLDALPSDTPGLHAAIAARMIYLNKTCFNGLHRVNRSGRFNTPFGHYPKPMICDEPNLRAVSRALQGVTIQHAPFIVAKHALAGDLVYFDPPYMPINDQSFTRYGAMGFGYGQHAELAQLARDLKAKGVHVIVSNSDAPRVRELYADGFVINEVMAARSINATGDGRGKIKELIIT